jgi:hypothetical protein
MSTIHDLTPLIETNTIQDRNIASNSINTRTSTDNVVVDNKGPSMPEDIFEETQTFESQIETLANEVTQAIEYITKMSDPLIRSKATVLILGIEERFKGLNRILDYNNLEYSNMSFISNQLRTIKNELLELKNLPGNAYNRTVNELSLFNNRIETKSPTANIPVKERTPLSASNINSRVNDSDIVAINAESRTRIQRIKALYIPIINELASAAPGAPGAPGAAPAAAPAETSAIRRVISGLGTAFGRLREYIPNLGAEAALTENKYYSNQIGGLPETREQELQRQLAEIQGQLAILQSARAHGPINNTHIPRKYADLCALLRSTESK